MLEARGLRVRHGPIEAVHGIDLDVGEGRCVALLGPNGAGKTSTLSAIVGAARSTGLDPPAGAGTDGAEHRGPFPRWRGAGA